MKFNKKQAAILIVTFLLFYVKPAQSQSIQDLDFLIGTWEVREDNIETDWWEKTIRVINYTLDSTYLELKANSITSSGKERTYTWFIHYNSKLNQFEMVSMFSNWHKMQLDILAFEPTSRKLVITNMPDLNEYHERYGELLFSEDFNSYTWQGQNKYGDSKDPSIWKYIEIGTRTKNHEQ